MILQDVRPQLFNVDNEIQHLKEPTQQEQILKHLKSHESITSLEALRRYGIMRLASRINDLKNMGYNITSEIVKGTNGKRWAEYKMEKNNGTNN